MCKPLLTTSHKDDGVAYAGMAVGDRLARTGTRSEDGDDFVRLCWTGIHVTHEDDGIRSSILGVRIDLAHQRVANGPR